jgi:hypothetical protein
MANQANLDEGYIALYRSFTRHDLFLRKPAAWCRIWLYMLCRANRIERTIDTDSGPVKLPVGSFLGSIRTIARDCATTSKVVRCCTHWLEKNEMAAQSAAQRFTVYHVVNFDFYQTGKQNRAQQGARSGHNEGTIGAQTGQQTRGKREEVEEKTNTCAPDDARELVLTPPEFLPNGKKSKSGPATCGWKWEAFQMFWAEYWRRTDKKPAWAAYHELINVPQDAAACKVAMLKARGPMLERDQEKRPMGATWLHRRTWLPEFADSEEVPIAHDLSWAMEEQP